MTGTASLAVGRSGIGSVLVDHATLLLSGGCYAGRFALSQGTITVINSGVLTQTASSAADQDTVGSGVSSNGQPQVGGMGTLDLISGGVATLANDLVVGDGGASGTVLVNGAGSRLTLGGRLFLGSGSGVTQSVGRLNVQAGGVVTLTSAANASQPYVVLGASAQSSGQVAVSDPGTILDAGATGLSVGDTGSGTLTISSGGTVRTAASGTLGQPALSTGRFAGTSGTITVTGAGSSLTVSGAVSIGQATASLLAVDQGATLTGGQGTGPASSDIVICNGTARVTNGGVLHSLGDLDVGRAGVNALITIDTAGRVVADGQVVTGLGSNGTGNITITHGGTLTAGGPPQSGMIGAVFGPEATSHSQVVVSGVGSAFTTRGDQLVVGGFGSASLFVAAGATVASGSGGPGAGTGLGVGLLEGSVGGVNVSGIGSMLTVAGSALLGSDYLGPGAPLQGQGSLSANAGGLIRMTDLVMNGASAIVVDPTGRIVLGGSAGAAGRLTVDAGAGLFGAGVVHATIQDDGSVLATGGTLAIDAVTGGGVLAAQGGTLVVGIAGGETLQFIGAGSVIQLNELAGNGQVVGFALGDALDFGAGLAATLAGNVVTLRQGSAVVGTETLAGLAPGVSVALVADGAGGQKLFAATRVKDKLVDAAHYYAHNPDVKAAEVDAAAHYLATGWTEGRNPDALFDTNYYLAQNPDVAAAHIDPLLHFEANGWKEGREPSLLFSDAKYLAANPDVKAAGIDPLAHYLASGQTEGRAAFLSGDSATADPLVAAAYYDPQLGATLIPTGAGAQSQAAYSYDAVGWQRGLNPDAYFNTAYYLSHNPDVAAAHINPLLHYEANGWREGRDPSAAFSTDKYLAAYGDVRAAGIDPLLHFAAFGQAEGRTAFAV